MRNGKPRAQYKPRQRGGKKVLFPVPSFVCRNWQHGGGACTLQCGVCAAEAAKYPANGLPAPVSPNEIENPKEGEQLTLKF